MENILKRQEIRVEIDGLKVKNPTPEQKAFIQETINSNYKIDEETNTLVKTEEGVNTDTILIKYMLRNLVTGIESLSDEDLEEAIKDPSLTLRKINSVFNEIVSEITQETLVAMMVDLKEVNLLHETSSVIEKLDTILKTTSVNKPKKELAVTPKKKGRPKKVK